MTKYIGIMSGTSMDAIDAAIIEFRQESLALISTISIPIPDEIKNSLVQLCASEQISFTLFGETDTALGILFAETCLGLLKKTGITSTEIAAIGSHGQTIYHKPNHTYPFTIQIGDPNIIAARTNITTVADFRRRDIALNGQGAPLVPAFHAYLFNQQSQDQWVVNIGGIANVTWLPRYSQHKIIGFDTGPGNTLLDFWNEKHQRTPLDFQGNWARSGTLNKKLLLHFLKDAYFQKTYPKSTGRDYFHLPWIEEKLRTFSENVSPQDVQHTLTELTAVTIAKSIKKLSSYSGSVWVCGGGAFNDFLIERIQWHCDSLYVQSTSTIGIDPKFIEAMAFAWLAKQTLEKKPANLPSVTGAKRSSILGAVYF